jgi:hypothetical protein
MGGSADGCQLLQDLVTVPFLFDHAGHAACLSFDPAQAAQKVVSQRGVLHCGHAAAPRGLTALNQRVPHIELVVQEGDAESRALLMPISETVFSTSSLPQQGQLTTCWAEDERISLSNRWPQALHSYS